MGDMTRPEIVEHAATWHNTWARGDPVESSKQTDHNVAPDMIMQEVAEAFPHQRAWNGTGWNRGGMGEEHDDGRGRGKGVEQGWNGGGMEGGGGMEVEWKWNGGGNGCGMVTCQEPLPQPLLMKIF